LWRAVARLAGLFDSVQLPGCSAVDDHERVGLPIYVDRVDGIEVVTGLALELGRGVGRTLIDLPTASDVLCRRPHPDRARPTIRSV
jgi:hypothetical protein